MCVCSQSCWKVPQSRKLIKILQVIRGNSVVMLEVRSPYPTRLFLDTTPLYNGKCVNLFGKMLTQGSTGSRAHRRRRQAPPRQVDWCKYRARSINLSSFFLGYQNFHR